LVRYGRKMDHIKEEGGDVRTTKGRGGKEAKVSKRKGIEDLIRHETK